MKGPLKKFPAAFYQSPNGAEPVREWLQTFSKADRGVLGKDIATVEFGWPIGMPICRPLSAGLWEIRSSLPSKREARVIFCVVKERIILLHGFIKKTQKTPLKELRLAASRKKEIET
jgi:phage-related protein